MAAKDSLKKGLGKVGILAPLIGSCIAKADTLMGPVSCTTRWGIQLGCRIKK